MAIPSRASALMLLLTAVIAGCDEPRPDGPDGDGDVDADIDADIDADADADADAGIDGDAESDGEADAPPGDADAEVDGGLVGPGPLTLLLSSAAFVLDRLCDFDGDGTLDNAFADLGSPAGEVLATAFNSAVTDTADHDDRLLIHLPRVDDRAAAAVTDGVAIFCSGLDTDMPPDPEDDLSGEEPFYAEADMLDPCGEPTTYLDGVDLRSGSLETSGASTVVEFSGFVPMVTTAMEGELLGGGGGGTVVMCTYATIHDLGALDDAGFPGGLTGLEALVAGGAPFGMVGMAGLTPDVDLDGDGLELIVLDGEYHVDSCVDGDFTIIRGRECWRDARMADAISLIVSLELVGARFAGLAPQWEERVEGTCDESPERSLWDGL